MPSRKPEEIDELISTWKSSRTADKKHMRKVNAQKGKELEILRAEDDGTTEVNVCGLTVSASLLDSGADESLVSCGVVDNLTGMECFIAFQQCEPVPLHPVGGGILSVSRKIRFDELALATPAGPLMLRGLVYWIDESDRSLSLTISRRVMKQLGYSTPKLLAEAKARSDEYLLDDSVPTGNEKPRFIVHVRGHAG
ncbi:hypothetical protein F442_10361 [Phytophthora nicotianae P10297]|uniref:Peptidase A2 domain-containing protein n=1 Tax=Phytophthora nicotianae P10297 TaxID=1317064 RepID=W2Z731_PHYNI|nr:hypothetical protein F442_10361 [Phytophthora nicotianae P10297]